MPSLPRRRAAPGRAWLASKIGQLNIVLVASPDRSDCTHISFEVAPNSDFSEMQKTLSAEGIASEIRSDPFPGPPKCLVFRDPKGTVIELFPSWSLTFLLTPTDPHHQ